MGGSGGGGGDASSEMPAPAMRTVRVVSAPVRSVMAGEAMRYRIVTSDPSVTFHALELPEGATLDSSGNLFWTPTPEQSGSRRVAVRVQAGDEAVTHAFSVIVGSARRQRSLAVDPNAPEATSITVDAPLSSIRGAGVQIEPGSLIGSEAVTVSISAIENAPVPPSAVVRRVNVSDLKPVELGPSGTAFRKAARVQLPVNAAVLGSDPDPGKRARPEVLTIDPVSGAWEKARVLAFDEQQGIVTAEIEHFSTYVVVPEIALIEGKLSRGAVGTACERSLMVRAPLAVSPGELPASFVNGFSGQAADLAGVLAALMPRQTLQVFLHVTARASDGPAERGWLLMTATRTDTGGFRVAVTGSQQSGAFLRLPDTMNATDAELLALLAGRKAHLIFNGLGDLDKGVAVTVEVSLYLVDGADADRPPLNPVNPVTRETFETKELLHDLPSDPGFDQDCDQAPEKDDMDPNGEPPPQIFGEPASPVHLVVGGTATLKARASAEDVTFQWAGSDPTLHLSASDGPSATIAPEQTGVYRVVVIGRRGMAESRYVWDVLVDAADTRTMNTPPEVKIASSAAVARVNETIALLAVGRDREQGDLRFAWRAKDPSVLAATSGPRVPFVATAPGDYEIECIASDGMVDSAPASLVLTVLPAAANRAPEAPVVTPLSAMVTHAPGQPGEITLHARSVDPDGDPVTFDFVPDPSVSRAVSLARMGASADVSSLVDGVFVFHVTAQDPHGATSPATSVRIQILPAEAIVVGSADSDGDGHPAGADCNDTSPDVFPGSREICGDGIDQNCDGRDLGLSECDVDGDRFTTEQGDCDDRDPARNPRMFERCDGVDNNCNGQIDENFQIGEFCFAGTGACRVAGRSRCSNTLASVVCDAQPGRPSPEMCDMVDNDCNGRVDDVVAMSAASAGGGCGGCGGSCAQTSNAVAACVVGGCVARCTPGFVDLDRDPSNGCECKVSNGGVEVCDGVDNDCSGRIDDGITEKVYAGDATTRDVGACAAGFLICRGGQLIEERAARLPTSEVCDGLDNDCNGKVDELYDLLHDARNCGACGITCSAGIKCELGRCAGGSAPTLPPPPPPAGGGGGNVQIGICPLPAGGTSCVDLQSDPANCGGCAKVCPEGMFCGLGSCVSRDKLPAGASPPPVIRPSCPLPPPPTSGGDAGAGGCPGELPDTCKGPAGNLYCTNLRFDNASCGACGVACPAGAFCRDGRCAQSGSTEPGDTAPAPACREPFKLCSDPFGGTHCTDLVHDLKNCGGCGIVCGNGTFCTEGRCVTGTMPPASTCQPPMTTCMGPEGKTYCTDVFNDPGNCGTCGTPCGAGTYCREGKCQTGAAPPPTCYPPMATCKVEDRIYCTDTFRDPGNCGACGTVCPAASYCSDGRCQTGAPPPPQCEPPRALCKSPREDLFCTDPNRDPTNCGACGIVCPQGTYCEAGKCQGGAPPPPTCYEPMKTCMDAAGGSYCTDPVRDFKNCGGCGIVCQQGTYCSDGRCVQGTPPPPPCYEPMKICMDPAGGSYCTDPRYDPRNCGACGTVCGGGTYCQDGRCLEAPPPVCEPPMKLCMDPGGKSYCTDPLRDSRNCGTCGVICGAGTYCGDGRCQTGSPPLPGCDPPMLKCTTAAGGSYCTDPRNDPHNCGGCGMVCAPETYCGDGRCQTGNPTPPACYPPMKICTDAAGVSICTDLLRDPRNCGGCNLVCAAGTTCGDGRCVDGGPPAAMCTPPFGTCPVGPGESFCADFMRDRYNCGACKIVCAQTEACISGKCTPPPAMSCQPPRSTCTPAQAPSYCADLNTDPFNCGACGKYCPGGAPCLAGTCGQPPR